MILKKEYACFDCNCDVQTKKAPAASLHVKKNRHAVRKGHKK